MLRSLRSLLTAGLLVALTAPLAPAANASAPAELTFASFNVCKVSCGESVGLPWGVRRDRVARVVSASGADVLGLQEATNNSTKWAKRQVDDIAAMIAPAGYAKVSFPKSADSCKRPRDSYGKLAGPSPCDNTSALFYNTATVKQVDLPTGAPSAGVAQLGDLAPGQDPRSASRSVMWAYLSAPTGSPFLAIALHTDSAKDPLAEASRVALGAGLGNWVTAHNNAAGLPGTPAVLMADLNSFAKRQPNGVQYQLTQTGWVDAFTAPTRTGVRYSTVNHSAKYRLNGFPAKPRVQKVTKKNPVGEAPRIDYIFTLGGQPLTYETVVHLKGKRFDTSFQASDHQLVKSLIALP